MRNCVNAAIFIIGFSLVLPCGAQVVGSIYPQQVDSAFGEAFTISIELDVAAPGTSLGSYGATLVWDSAALGYVSDSGGGDSPFDAAVVNRLSVGSGSLSFSDASAVGATGRVKVLEVTFVPVMGPPTTASLDLEFTSLFDGETLEDLAPVLTVEDSATCVSDFAFNLRVTDEMNTTVNWDPIPGAEHYDVIRLSMSNLNDDGVDINLGAAVCIEDDSLDTTTAAGNVDGSVPVIGEVFIYMVRFKDSLENRSYGFAAACSRERVVQTGDCS